MKPNTIAQIAAVEAGPGISMLPRKEKVEKVERREGEQYAKGNESIAEKEK